MVHVPLTVRSWDELGVVVEVSDPVTVEAAAKDEDRQKRSVPATAKYTVAVLVRLTVVLPPPSAGGSLSHCRFIDDNQTTANCIPDRFINSVHFVFSFGVNLQVACLTEAQALLLQHNQQCKPQRELPY